MPDRQRLPGVQRRLLSVVAAVLLVSCIAPVFPREMLLQHLPTVAALLALPPVLRRTPMSDAAVACLAAFLLLHILGARYIYSYVPYDRWVEAVSGVSLSETFGWRRNHYDRLVHFAYGALFVVPIRELLIRHLGLSRHLATYVAVEFILASSLLYELFEWALTLVMAPDASEAYNGQQGDMWDAQKDMFLASLGAVMTTMRLSCPRRAGQC